MWAPMAATSPTFATEKAAARTATTGTRARRPDTTKAATIGSGGSNTGAEADNDGKKGGHLATHTRKNATGSSAPVANKQLGEADNNKTRWAVQFANFGKFSRECRKY